MPSMRWCLVLSAAACGWAAASGCAGSVAGAGGAGGDGPLGNGSPPAAATSTSGASSGSHHACVPGQQVACACLVGHAGAQRCLPDGSGLGPCEGCQGSTGATATAGAGGGAGGTKGSGGHGGAAGAAGSAGAAMACDLCAELDCKQPIAACSAIPDCKSWLNCVAVCPAPTCAAQCSAQHPATATEQAALYACACSSCPSECAVAIDPCHPGGLGGAGGV